MRKLCRTRRFLYHEPTNRHRRQPTRSKMRAGLKIMPIVRGKTTVEKASHKATLKSRRPTATESGASVVSLVFYVNRTLARSTDPLIHLGLFSPI